MSAAASFSLGCLSFVDRLVPDAQRATPRERHAVRCLVLLGGLSALSAPPLTLMYHLLGYDAAGMVVLTGGVAMMVAPFSLGAGVGLAAARDLFIGALFLLKIWLALHLGGLSAPTLSWFALCPMIAMLIGGTRPALIWAGLVALAMLALFWLGRGGGLTAHPVADQPVLELVSILGLVALATVIVLCLRLAPGPGRVRGERRH